MSSAPGVRIIPHLPQPYPVGVGFLRQIAFPDGYHGCWLWTGPTKGERGYGRYGRLLAGRVALAGGVLAAEAETRQVIYGCRNHLCVRPHPDHLRWREAR